MRNIYLNKKKEYIQNREEWFKEYQQDIDTKSYLDIVKGAPILVRIDSLYVYENDIEKLMPFKDRAYWNLKGRPFYCLHWKK